MAYLGIASELPRHPSANIIENAYCGKLIGVSRRGTKDEDHSLLTNVKGARFSYPVKESNRVSVEERKVRVCRWVEMQQPPPRLSLP